VVVFFTLPINRVPSTLTSSTCTSEGGASLKSLSILGSSFAVISAAVSSLAGWASGGSIEAAQGDPMPTSNHQAGYADQAPGLELLAQGPVGQIERVGGGGAAREKALDRATQRAEPLELPLRRVCPPGFKPANTIDSRNSRIRFMVAPPMAIHWLV
jgi:hypothetical protein